MVGTGAAAGKEEGAVVLVAACEYSICCCSLSGRPGDFRCDGALAGRAGGAGASSTSARSSAVSVAPSPKLTPARKHSFRQTVNTVFASSCIRKSFSDASVTDRSPEPRTSAFKSLISQASRVSCRRSGVNFAFARHLWRKSCPLTFSMISSAVPAPRAKASASAMIGRVPKIRRSPV